MKKPGEHGDLIHEGKTWVVRGIDGDGWLSSEVEQGTSLVEGVEPESELGEGNVFRKVFRNKPIYPADKYEEAVLACLKGEDVISIGGNGYSNLNLPWADWGVPRGPQHYMEACARVFAEQVKIIEDEYDRVDVTLAHGASGAGVDLALMNVADKFKLRNLGHSCPNFMLFVTDDNRPVWVGKNKEEYTNGFVRSCDILVACNGKQHALTHDWKAAFEGIAIYEDADDPKKISGYKRPRLIPINVLRAISNNSGGPPGLDANGFVVDATAAYHEIILAEANPNIMEQHGDPFDCLLNHVKMATRYLARSLVSSQRAFGNWKT